MRWIIFCVVGTIVFSCHVEPVVEEDELKEYVKKERVFYITPKQVKAEAYRQGRFLSGEARRTLFENDERRWTGILDSIGHYYNTEMVILNDKNKSDGRFEKGVFEVFKGYQEQGATPDSVAIYDTTVVYMKPFMKDGKNEGVWKIRMSRIELMKGARVN